jgi:hypothetical protein
MELPQIFTGALAKLIMADKHTALSSGRDIGLHNYRPFPVNGDTDLSLVFLRKMGPQDSNGNRRSVVHIIHIKKSKKMQKCIAVYFIFI